MGTREGAPRSQLPRCGVPRGAELPGEDPTPGTVSQVPAPHPSRRGWRATHLGLGTEASGRPLCGAGRRQQPALWPAGLGGRRPGSMRGPWAFRAE